LVISYIFSKQEEFDELTKEKINYRMKIISKDIVPKKCGKDYSYDKLCELEINIDIELDSGENRILL